MRYSKWTSGPRTRRARLIASWTLLIALVIAGAPAVASARPGAKPSASVTWLYADDFTYGTYIIDRPGTYRLAEDISFNPNSPSTLDAALTSGAIDPGSAAALDLKAPVDAYRAGWPLATQFLRGPAGSFTPGGPTDARYDPAAYGVGFFAAIAIEADGVVLDLNGHTIEQSAEHALLQRFFAVIELADQPFVPNQGPAGFGDELDPATDVVIENGTIGRSSHHGIHGNDNEDIVVRDVDFVDYEVAAIALNGVDGLRVTRVTAANRTDVPVLGTFSSARFISVYLDDLVRRGTTTTLTVDGVTRTAAEIRDDLRQSINNTHHDVVSTGGIDRTAHPDEHALFDNPARVVDGNSYSFLTNAFGVAVNGFPTRPPKDARSSDIRFRDVHVVRQHSAINEIPALSIDDDAMIDPVGAVFQVANIDPATGSPVTISSLDLSKARYTGNAVADAQALVSKAIAAGDFEGTRLDIGRANISPAMLAWVENEPGSSTLAQIGAEFICNGDSMFHVNKGAIGFKIDGAHRVRMTTTSVSDLVNFGATGTDLCDYLRTTRSHRLATLTGYQGAAVRGYTFAGSSDVRVRYGYAKHLRSSNGSATGFEVLTDSRRVRLIDTHVHGLVAGADLAGPHDPAGPNHPAIATGWVIGPDATKTVVRRPCAGSLSGLEGAVEIADQGTGTRVRGICRSG